MRNNSKTTYVAAILSVLEAHYPDFLKSPEIANELEPLGYERATVMSKVKILLDDGHIVTDNNPEKRKRGYRLKDAPTNKTKNPLANIVSNAQAPKNPDTIEPMSDDEWQKEYNKIVRTRKWVQLPLEKMYSLIEDINDGLISLDDLGEIFIIYCKCIVEIRHIG